MSVTTTPLSRRRAMTTGLAGAAALMTLAPTRARARDAELAGRLDETIDRALADRKIVGTLVTVVRSGDVAYRRAAGYADREAGRAMRADTLFRLASLSKTMVSAAALALVEQGRLAVTDPVAQWLPDFTPKTRDGQVPVLTVHHLLTHTAGLSYGFYEPEDGPYHQAGVSDGLDLSGLSLGEEVRRIAAAGLAEAPGTRWRYSIASDVLGAVIARAAGEPLPDAVRRLVTAPLGMADTGFSVTDPMRLAVPYADAQPAPVRMGEPQLVSFRGLGLLRFSPSRVFDPAQFASGGAGMVGSADDLVSFLEALRTGGGPILQPATAGRMTSNRIGALPLPAQPGWGFGYGCITLEDRATAKTPQSAGTWAFTSAYGHSYFVDPERQLSVVALTNTALEGGFGAFVPAIRNAVYG
jgi:CubicO group peptidase (beta-lactamase class C family)